MPFEILSASDQEEQAVAALHAAVAVPQREAAWQRSFGEEGHPAWRGEPWVVMNDGKAMAFATLRHADLRLGNEPFPVQIVQDLVAMPADEGSTAARKLLEEARLPGTLLSLYGGPGQAAQRLLREGQWMHIGNLPRYRLRPAKRREDPPRWGRGAPPQGLESVQSAWEEETMAFLYRPAGLDLYLAAYPDSDKFRCWRDDPEHPIAYWRLLKQASQHSSRGEWLVVDGRFTADQAENAVAVLWQIAEYTAQTVYLTFWRDSLARALEKAKAEALVRRWGMFARAHSQMEGRLLRRLREEGKWHLMPADLDLDL